MWPDLGARIFRVAFFSSCSIVSKTSRALLRGTIRFRTALSSPGRAVYLHAGPLSKPPPLFHSYRCVKLSERERGGGEASSPQGGSLGSRARDPPRRCTPDTRPDPCFQAGSTEVSARALYQVWVKLLEHQTPRARLLYLFKLRVRRCAPRPRDRVNYALRRAIMSSRCAGKFMVCQRGELSRDRPAECWHLLYVPFEKSDIIR